MNRLLTPMLVFFFSVSLFAQTGKIAGKITDQNNIAILGANVTLANSSFGTVTNEEGKFTLKNVPAGNYTVEVSYVGFKKYTQQISLTAQQTLTLETIALTYSQEALNTVFIQGQQANKFTREKSVYVSKLPLKDIENPQVYNTVTAEVMKSQVVTNFDDALKNVPGISKLWESTGRGGDGAGYYSVRGFAVQPTLVNGLPGITNASPDPANIERIEVMKGPSGTLYGSSLISYGGLINIVTKKPYNTFGGNISYTTGSYGLNRIAADINTPLKEGVALRINAAYHDENSFQDAGHKTSYYFAPSLSYKVNDKLSFLINTEFYSGESTNPTMLFVDRGHELRVHNMNELKYDRKKSYTSDDITLKNPTYSLQGQMNYQLTHNWSSQTVYSRSSSKSKGLYSYLYESTYLYDTDDPANGLPINGTLLNDGVVFDRYMNHQNATTLTTDIQQNFIGDFNIGSLRNRMVAGLDYFQQSSKNSSTGYVSNGLVYIGTASQQNVNESVYGITNPDNYLSSYDNGILSEVGSNNLLAGLPVNLSEAKQETYSAYVSDVINILPELSAMASLRVDQFENSDNSQTAFSPKFGLVYQPILNKLSVFANYMDGFSNVAPQPGKVSEADDTPKTYEFDPEHAKQLEVGSKLNLLNNKLTATLSYYDIQVSNTVITIAPDVYSQGGELYSRGFEANFVANPVKGLNIIAGYSHNESELTKASTGDDFVGRRPESAGPKDMANLWANYRFSKGKLTGFGAGFGGNYASENMIFNRNTAGVFTLGSYTVLNASLSYDTDKFGITLKLNNLTDKEYYNGWSTINPQLGRNMLAEFTYKF